MYVGSYVFNLFPIIPSYYQNVSVVFKQTYLNPYLFVSFKNILPIFTFFLTAIKIPSPTRFQTKQNSMFSVFFTMPINIVLM